MAIYCTMTTVFYANTSEGIKNLTKLHDELTQESLPPDIQSVIEGKGGINHVDDEIEENSFRIDMDIQWGLFHDLWDAVLKQYSGVYFVYSIEEHENRRYICTDTEGRFLKERFIMDARYNFVNFESDFPDGCFALNATIDDIREFLTEGFSFYESLESLLSCWNKVTGRMFTTEAEIERYINDVVANYLRQNESEGSIDCWDGESLPFTIHRYATNYESFV